MDKAIGDVRADRCVNAENTDSRSPNLASVVWGLQCKRDAGLGFIGENPTGKIHGVDADRNRRGRRGYAPQALDPLLRLQVPSVEYSEYVSKAALPCS